MRLKAIASRDNPGYKQLQRLASSSQARKREGLSLLDGVHLVSAYFEQIGAPEVLAVSESGVAHPEIAALLARAVGEVLQLPDQLFAAVSQVEHGVGVIAAVRTPHPQLPARLEGDCLLIEHLQDPGNLGSLLRSAAAAGIAHVLLSMQTVYAWSPKVLRSGQGAHFGMAIYEGVDLAEALPRLQARLIATSSHADAALYDADLRGPVAWLLGNEGAGVSEAMLQAAALRVSIPLTGAAESLNVAAAGAICMFEALRQRRAAGGEKKLKDPGGAMGSTARRLACFALAGALAVGLSACAAIATQAALSLASPELFATMIGDSEVRSEFKESAPLMKKKDWLGLIILARQKLDRDPKRGQWWEIAGYGHLQLGENALARDCFAEAVRLIPEEGGAWNFYAYALKNLGDNRRGLEAVQRALQIDPYSGTAYVILGDLRRESGQSQEALLAYNRAIEIDSADVFAWYGLGLIGKRTRDAALYEKAKKALEEQLYKPMVEQLEKA